MQDASNVKLPLYAYSCEKKGHSAKSTSDIKEIVLSELNFKENNFFMLNLNSKRVMEIAEKISSVYFKILFALCTFERGQTVPVDYLKNLISNEKKSNYNNEEKVKDEEDSIIYTYMFHNETIKAMETEELKVIEILNFWSENGFISFQYKKLENEFDDRMYDSIKKAKSEKEPVILFDDICEVLETQESFRIFIKKSQNIFGKMFNPNELQIMYKLCSIYKIDEKLLMAVMEVCKGSNHNSVTYFEKVAIDLYTNGIFTYEQYKSNYEKSKKFTKNEPKIKEIFGIVDKKFTSKEKATVKKWIGEYNYDLDIIQKAYDICMTRLGKYQFNYISKIILNWNKDGCRTLNDIESINEKYNYNNIKPESSSFDIEEFFNKAVQLGMQGFE